MVHAQDLAHVIDNDYIPMTPDDIALFHLQQDYLYQVFQKILATDKGKELVAKYTKQRDAQQIYRNLLAHSQISAAADVELEALDDFLQNSRLDGTWKGTTAGYVAHWQTQMHAHDELAEEADCHTDSAKKRMLAHAVAGIPDLASIRDTDEVFLTMASNVVGTSSNGLCPCTTRMNYEQYAAALAAACVRYDTKHRTVAHRTRTRTTANTHALEYDPYQLRVNAHNANYVDDGNTFDESETASLYDLSIYSAERPQDVYAAAQQCSRPDRPPCSPNRPWVPHELFELMKQNPELVAAWNSFDWNKAPANASIQDRQNATHRANIHDLDYESFIGLIDSIPAMPMQPDFTHMVHQAMSDFFAASASPDIERGVTSAENSLPESPVDSNPILAHLTQQKPIEDGNLHTLIQQAARKPTTTTKESDI